MTQIGILHSLSGTMSLSETPLIKAAQMAVDEINQAGGVLGKPLEAVVADGASDPNIFARQAIKLTQKGINTIFGCWTSSCRKAVQPVVEETNSILWYPIQYEGLEQSPNIFYFGCTLNQQIEPAVNWSIDHLGESIFLIGSDYVFPRVANRLIRSLANHIGGKVIGETYVPLEGKDFDASLEMIRQSRPDVVFSTINGDSNIAFYREMKQQGMSSRKFPIMAFSVAETEIADVAEDAAGHYACWSYFQSLSTTENNRFIKAFQAYNGGPVEISDPIVTAYSQIHIWARVANAIGSTEPKLIRQAAVRKDFESPLGQLTINSNQHITRWARIGKIQPNGQFNIIWESDNPIEPLPWLGLDSFDLPSIDLIKATLAELPNAIDIAAKMKQEVSARKAIEKQLKLAVQELETLSFYDTLTGVANRRLFNQLLLREWRRSCREQQLISLIMLDIDFYKQYNDHYGHLQGDICLKQVAQALRNVSKRPGDLFARYGGEEFALLLPDTSKEQAIRLAKKCCSVVSDLQLEHNQSLVSEYVTVSAGVSTSVPTDGWLRPNDLIIDADKALYTAKELGRNQAVPYELPQQG